MFVWRHTPVILRVWHLKSGASFQREHDCMSYILLCTLRQLPDNLPQVSQPSASLRRESLAGTATWELEPPLCRQFAPSLLNKRISSPHALTIVCTASLAAARMAGPQLLLVLLMSYALSSEAYPGLFANKRAEGCLDHPGVKFAGHGAPKPDRWVALRSTSHSSCNGGSGKASRDQSAFRGVTPGSIPAAHATAWRQHQPSTATAAAAPPQHDHVRCQGFQGTSKKSFCPGGTYKIDVQFVEERQALLTASNGVLGTGDKRW
jgi:hypothetical protein